MARTTGIVAAIVLGTALNVVADFAADFQAAKTLFDKGQYQEAGQTFSNLAASAPNAHGKAWSLSYAAMALGRQKQYDQALELAKTIEGKPMAAYTQMAIMDANQRHKELAAAFKDEDIAAWPDPINYKGFFLRGVARSVAGDKQASLKDFEQCVRLAGSDAELKLDALNRLAALCHDLGDDAKAMSTYETAFALYEQEPRWRGRWLYPQALLAAARLLMAQGKYDEAKATLAKFSVKASQADRGPWDFLVLEAYGDILAAQGKPADARAKYQEAVAIKTHESYVARVKKKIEELGKK